MDEQGQVQRYAFYTCLGLILMVVVALVVVFFAGLQTRTDPPLSAMRTIECRVEVRATDSDATRFSSEQKDVHLGPPTSFHVAEAYRYYNSLGGPAVGFRLATPEWPAFRRFTAAAAHQNQQVAFLVGGRIVQLAYVKSPLPGSGTLDGWPDFFTDVEVQAVVEALQPASR